MYHFVSHWILSAMRYQEPELHWVLKPGMSSQLEDHGFWLGSSPSHVASIPGTWVQVSIWSEQFPFFLRHKNTLVPWAPRWHSGKESTCQYRRCEFDPWVRKTHWRRKWQPTSVFFPGKSHGQSSLMGCSPGGHKVSDTTCSLWTFLSGRTSSSRSRISGLCSLGPAPRRWGSCLSRRYSVMMA